MPRLRQNIVTGDWVVIAPGRAKRPEDFVMEKPRRAEMKGPCPFCKGGEAYSKAIKEHQTVNVYATANKFPAFVENVQEAPPITTDLGIYKSLPSLGGHEVIVIADHLHDISHLKPEEVTDLLWVYQQRYLFYEKKAHSAYTMIIHNHGPDAAASITHPHSQLFSSCIIPNYIKSELAGAKKYHQAKSECVFCAIIAQEKKSKERIVFENDHFIAFTFFAARFPFEMWLLPKKHNPNFEDMGKEELRSLAQIMKDVLMRYDIKLNDPSLNFFIHTSPHKRTNSADYNSEEGAKYYHWHIEFAPRLSKFGGYELGSGMIIDVVSPEHAAEFLRKI